MIRSTTEPVKRLLDETTSRHPQSELAQDARDEAREAAAEMAAEAKAEDDADRYDIAHWAEP